jgi:hypothetical protein
MCATGIAGGREAGAPWGFGTDLVAARHAREPVARVEHEVEGGRGKPDQRLDAAPPGPLLGGPVGHGRAIVDSLAC